MTDPTAPNVRLVLGSTSPRRRTLLAEAGYDFDVIAPADDAEGEIGASESLATAVVRLAVAKGESVAARIAAQRHGDADAADGALPPGPTVIVAADTVADLRGQVLGKPRDADDARSMLTALAGTEHRVHTGVTLIELPTGRRETFLATATLAMRTITDAEIDAHLASDRWVGKAGAFGFQDGNDWLTLISGEGSTVVGLPIERLAERLTAWGVPRR